MAYAGADSEYYRKAARVMHTARYAVLLLLLGVAVLSFTAYKDELTVDNFRYLMRYADFDIATDYLSLNQIKYSTSEDTRYGYIKGDLALLTKRSFTTFDFSGKPLVSEKLTYLHPCMKTSAKMALCFDVGGTGVALFNSYSCLFSDTFRYGVRDAAIAEDGSFAVATSDKYVSSKVIVYDPHLVSDFEWTTRDKEVTALALNSDRHTVCFLTLKSDSGDFALTLYAFDTRKDEEMFNTAFPGEFPLKLCACKDTIAVLTDRNLYFIGYDGEEKARYSVLDGKLRGFFESGDYIAVSFEKNMSGGNTVRVYTKDGEELSGDSFDGNIIDFSASGSDIYLLEKGKLHVRRADNAARTLEYKNISETQIDPMYCAVFAKSGKEYILASNVGAGKFS